MIDQCQITRDLVTPQYTPTWKYFQTNSPVPNSIPKSCQFLFKQTKPHTLLSCIQGGGGLPLLPSVSINILGETFSKFPPHGKTLH